MGLTLLPLHTHNSLEPKPRGIPGCSRHCRLGLRVHPTMGHSPIKCYHRRQGLPFLPSPRRPSTPTLSPPRSPGQVQVPQWDPGTLYEPTHDKVQHLSYLRERERERERVSLLFFVLSFFFFLFCVFFFLLLLLFSSLTYLRIYKAKHYKNTE